jgi:predicted nucleic acid-binding protein
VILVDTSIWVDHLRRRDLKLITLLEAGRVLAHPFVTGELALGRLHPRSTILAHLAELPQARVATDREVLEFIDLHALSGLGVGYIDVHLLAAVLLTEDATLWTRDKRLYAVASRLHLTADGAAGA